MRRSRLVDWGVTIGIAVAFVLVFEAEVAKPYRIPSSSMEPTLHCAKPGQWCEARFNDRIIVNRLAYRFESPKRGQIVVFHPPKAAAADGCTGATFVKRLVGLPGDTITERDGHFSVDGKPFEDGYVQAANRGHGSGTWHVPQGRYFFLGDDRIHSCDSRVWGTVPHKSLVGPVVLTYWPPNRISLH